MEKYCDNNDSNTSILTFSRQNIRFYSPDLDHEPIFQTFKLIFEEDFFIHTHADTVSSLYQQISQDNFDLLIFNVEKPEDLSVLKEVKAISPQTPVFLLYYPYTIEGSLREEFVALSDGSTQIPFGWDVTRLRQEINEILSRPQKPGQVQRGNTYALP